MARKDDAPAISLFSFQDIITSLTGIMFLIVLLLILFMLEMRPNAERQAVRQDRRILAEARAELEKMQAQLQSLQKNETDLEKRVETLQQENLEHILEKLQETKLALQEIRQEEKSLHASLRKEQARAENGKKETDALVQENRQLQDRAESEKKQLDLLRKAVQRSRVRSEQLKHVLRYTVENASTLSPVLAECSKSGIRLLKCATGERIDLPCGDGSAAARQQAFLDYLAHHDTRGEYYTILIKPETFEDAELVGRLKERGIARGLELLPDNALTLFGGTEK